MANIIGKFNASSMMFIATFLSNNENKNQLVLLIFEYIRQSYLDILVKFATEIRFLTGDSEYLCITNRSYNPYPSLVRNQEEAYIKVILHRINVFNYN